jgi:hypothetical protein
MRAPKIKSRPVTITLWHKGQVLAGNGKVIHETGGYFTPKLAEEAARRWLDSRHIPLPRLEGD